jgi:hypothetical protein
LNSNTTTRILQPRLARWKIFQGHVFVMSQAKVSLMEAWILTAGSKFISADLQRSSFGN